MATFMPVWPEWQVEYVGSSILGKLLGSWTAFWIRLRRMPFASSRREKRKSRYENGTLARLSSFEVRIKLYRLAISTVLMLCFCRVASLKPLWSAFDDSAHRVILELLFRCFCSASWLISVVWICLSKVHRRG